MGLFDLFKKHTKNITKVTPKKETNSLDYFLPKIPQDVQELLWFSDGDKKNIDVDLAEPSAISFQLPVSPNPPEDLGYWPNYSEMSPEQRYAYLQWLTNIDQITDMGNVFTFFYGLERYLNTSKYDQAIKMIVHLKKHHNENSSFNYYSNSALVYAAMLYKNSSYLQYLTPKTSSSLLLLAKGSLDKRLSALEIMHAAKDFNWENLRYIKNNADLFQEKLEAIMIEKYGGKYYPIPDKIEEVPMVELRLSNVSLAVEHNNIGSTTINVLNPITVSIPDFSKSRNIMIDVYQLLKEAHDQSKRALKELRKTRPYTNNKTQTQKTKRINPKTGYPMSTDKAIKRAEENYNMTIANIPHRQETLEELKKTGLPIDKQFLQESKIMKEASPHFNLGELYYKQGKWDEAEKEWLKSLKLMGENSATKLAIMYHKEKRFKDEIAIIKDGIKYGKDSSSYHFSDKLPLRLEKANANLEKNVSKDQSRGYQL